MIDGKMRAFCSSVPTRTSTPAIISEIASASCGACAFSSSLNRTHISMGSSPRPSPGTAASITPAWANARFTAGMSNVPVR